MADASAVLSTALAAFALVYQAYTSIKTNKERCAHLVERCQAVVDRLEAITVVSGDAAVRSRLGDLEQAFRKTAETIHDVGHQGVIKSLLRSDDNALRLEDCQHALSELVTLLSLEHVVDMSSWQQENETARRRDHSELVEMGRQLKQGNVVIMSELCLHGTTLSELSDAVNNISFMMSRQHTPGSSRLSSSSFETRQRSASFSTTPPLARFSGNPTDPTYARKARRLSMPGSSFTRFSGTAPGHCFESTSEANRVASQTIDACATPFQTPLSSLSKDLPPTPPPSYRSDSFRSVSSQVVPPNDQHTAPPRPDVPLRPKLTKRSDSATSRIIVTAENHPVSSVQTTYDAPRVADGRLLVELCIAPSSASLQSSIISLKSFIPLAAEHLNLAQEYAKVISDILRPMLLQVRAGADHEGILLLCPRGMCPSVVKLGKKPRRQLNLVKAYILNTPAKMTLVSVMYKRKISHVLIPYTGEMTVNHAKEFVVQHYGNITIQSCRHVDRNVELKDVDTLRGIGVQAYRHNLTMTVARSHNRQ